jgi:putative colanic acid biosynthesis UDP-glucose lipid carrier transferase
MIVRLQELPVNVYLGSDMAGFIYPRLSFSSIGGVPMLGMAHKPRPLSGWSRVLKILEDRAIAAIVLVLISPLLLLIALAIKLDSRGPVLFRQPRYGFNNRIFYVFKFRTMYHNRPPEQEVQQAKRDDPRVTRVGKWLRRTSLDELPQLLNVLQGTMSLVGPRPHPVALNEQYAELIGGYFSRHRVKPGITGWAQVCGLRGETEGAEKMRARVEHDIHYIENWSLWFDLLILARTLVAGFVHKNAY